MIKTREAGTRDIGTRDIGTRDIGTRDMADPRMDDVMEKCRLGKEYERTKHDQ
jgi:hypothetical protein